ncbi:MAG: caspase family protein [Aureispira sp.]|nr:caspase family protein [Aureispira sp.]
MYKLYLSALVLGICMNMGTLKAQQKLGTDTREATRTVNIPVEACRISWAESYKLEEENLVFKNKTALRFSVRAAHSIEEQDIELYINGERFEGELVKHIANPLKADQTKKIKVIKNIDLKFDLSNKYCGEEVSAQIKIKKEGALKGESPEILLRYKCKAKLHLVTIGVKSNLSYTEKDAQDFKKAFLAENNSKLYGVDGLYLDEIDTYHVDGEVKKSDVENAIRHIQNNSKKGDIIILYVSSHGYIGVEGEHRIQMSDFRVDTENPNVAKNSSIEYKRDILEELDGALGHKVVFLDLCRGTQVRSGLAYPESKKITTFWPTQPNHVSVEVSSRKHGAFTAALLDGIGGKADVNEDNAISLSEICSYLKEATPEISKEASIIQKPDCTIAPQQDFIFYKY